MRGAGGNNEIQTDASSAEPLEAVPGDSGAESSGEHSATIYHEHSDIL